MPLEFVRRYTPELMFIFFGLIFALVVSGLFEGEVAAFLTAALDVTPFVILAMLSYIAEGRGGVLRWVTIVWLFLLIGGIAAVAAGFGVLSILPAEVLDTGEFDLDMALLLLGTLGAAAASLIGLSRRLRVWLSRYLPIDPGSFVQGVALVTVLALILIPPVPLLVVGVPPYLSEPFIKLLTESGDIFADTVRINAYGLFWTLIASFLIAGACVRRTFPEVLERLGLVRPTGREVAFAVFAAFVLVVAFHFIDPMLATLVGYLG
ncbi:MAG: CPBP family intramembrane metalloprotease, partial [Methanomicrobiales archaeon]|nr:CPBP family intramembrane metalloprotease [Methanomicrobiales archaeon]